VKLAARYAAIADPDRGAGPLATLTGDGLRTASTGWRWLEYVALAGVLAVAAGLRLYRLDAQSLWYDEGISAYQLTRDFLGILQAAAGDTHPPLYYWTLKVWSGAFGLSEWGLRSLSAVGGVATVLLTWVIGRALLGAGAALLAALLLAVSPLAVYYSQETRMYGLVPALALSAVWLGVRWLRSGRSGWTASLGLYPVVAAAALYTQYLGAMMLAALNLAVVPALLRQPRRLVTWLTAQAAVAMLFAPWLPTFVEQLTQRSLNTSPRTASNLLVQASAAVSFGPFADASGLQISALILPSLAALGVALMRRSATMALLLGLLALVPLAGVLGMGLRNGLFEVRYLVLALPGLTLLAGAALAGLAVNRLRLLSLLAAGLLFALLVPSVAALARQYFDPATFRDDYRGLARDIQAHAREGDAVVLDAGNQWEVFSFYYAGPASVYRLPERRPIDLASTRARLDEIRQRHKRVWMVLWASREGDPSGFIEDWFSANAFQGSHTWYGTVQLLLYAFPSSGDPGRVPLDVVLDNGARILAFTLQDARAAPGETVGLTLYWRAERPIQERYKVFTQLLNAEPSVVAQRDSEPVGTLRPTPTWQVGEEIPDNYGIVLPADVPPGHYALIVGMYDSDSGRRPAIRDVSGRPLGDHLVLGQVEVTGK
jgi:hypothetical protein